MAPQTRYAETYEQATGRRLPDEPYQVSDDQLAEEAHQAQLTADATRAAELLATSPAVITMPDLWELMRIFGRRLGLSGEVINDNP